MANKDRSGEKGLKGDKTDSLLGLPTEELAGLSVDEIVANKTAVTMLLHYYKKLTDENTSLRNDLNTLKTYEDGYQRKKVYSGIGATLLALSNIVVGFGVNLMTSGQPALLSYGKGMLVVAIIAIVVGLYYSYFKD